MGDPLACTSLPCWVPRVGLGGGVDREGYRSCGSGLSGGVLIADNVVPEGFPFDLPGPVGGQVQGGFAGRGGEAGWDVDQVPAQGGAAGGSVVAAGDGPGGAQQVV